LAGFGRELGIESQAQVYRGRLAPSPTGYLHLGHARTFWIASERARIAGGTVILRSDDLDAARFHLEYAEAMLEDLRWLGLRWTEGPDVGGPHAPYSQSARRSVYRAALEKLHDQGLIYPCSRSRSDVLEAAGAPHEGTGDEPVYPAQFRPDPAVPLPPLGDVVNVNWRLRVPDGEELCFVDGHRGLQTAVAGKSFGDFPVWRKDDCPSYQLACAVDDAEMGITEVVRGEDLIRSTFRQLLVYRALGHTPPAFYHCALMTDENGERLAKRHDALSLRTLRTRGTRPEDLLAQFGA
jgi:glutamyl/glutaminyl-tRNA synthetase